MTEQPALFDLSNKYPEAFLAARKAYGPPPNDAAADAFKAWKQVEKLMPAQDLLLAAIAEYNLFLAQENAKRKKLRQSDYPKRHMSTWLRQQIWNDYMDGARSRVTKKASTSAPIGRDDPTGFWGRLEKSIGRDALNAWFFPNTTHFDPEAGTIRVGKQYQVNWIQKHYQGQIDRAAGKEITIKL